MPHNRPNILVIITDQQRFDTISANVNRFGVSTPALDRMARDGVVFNNMFTTNPICTPARSAAWTGRMPTQVEMPGNIGAPNGPMNYSVTTIAHRMANAGYSTVYHGKSHLGTDLGQLGFKTHYENSFDEATRIEACRYWRNRDWMIQKRPFFHIVSLLDPHDIYFLEPGEERPVELEPWPNCDDDLSTKPWPQQQHSRGRGWSPDRWEYYRQFYRSRVEKVDRDIGMLLEELVMSGFGPNTWVIVMADHGDMAGEHGCAFKGPFLYDAQMRIPFIIMPPRTAYTGPWLNEPPEGFRPRVTEALCSNLDLVPTILDIAGLEPDPELRGRSLLPIVAGREQDNHEAVFGEFTQGGCLCPARMVRTRRWKYTFYLGHGEELYDLEADPWEITNLATSAEHAGTLHEMRERLWAFVRETRDPIFTMQPTNARGEPFTTVPIEVPEGCLFPPGTRQVK